jgi:hypothetical protein
VAASKNTVESVLDVIERRVEPRVVLAICEDLVTVPGNKSFRTTVEMLHARARKRQQEAA